jgi:hypothetical protein
VVTATLDGVPVDCLTIPLVNDGHAHDVRVVLGAASAQAHVGSSSQP